MNTMNCKLFVAACLLVASVSVYAQKRPVWLLGHRCNDMKMIEWALADGANGVEIDICTGPTKGEQWSVSHGHFHDEKQCDDHTWMTLKTLLNKPILNDNSHNFCLLFLDIKDTDHDCIVKLVNYIHTNCPNPNYYILYGLNLDKISETKKKGKQIKDKTIEFLRDNLKANEGFCTQTDTEVKFIETKLKSLKYPRSQYSYVDGCCVGTAGKFSHVRDAAARRDAGFLCARTGYWSCQYVRTAKGTYDKAHCDFTMTECRGWGATHAWRHTLKKTAEYLTSHSNYYMAGKGEKFFWK